MRRLVGGHGRGWMQYKMFAGDQGREGLIRHWHMLHGACLDELRRHGGRCERGRRKHEGSWIDHFCRSANTTPKAAMAVFPQRHTNSVSKIKPPRDTVGLGVSRLAKNTDNTS